MQGWSKRKFWKLLQSGSTCGSLQRHVGRKKGKACRVCRAAWHFVTVTVEQATVTVKLLLSGCAHCRWQIRHLNEPRAWIYFTNLSRVECFSLNTWCSTLKKTKRVQFEYVNDVVKIQTPPIPPRLNENRKNSNSINSRACFIHFHFRFRKNYVLWMQ